MNIVDPKAETVKIDMKEVIRLIEERRGQEQAEEEKTPMKKLRTALHLFLLLAFSLFASGCTLLDFGGDDERDWELQFFWDGGPDIGEEDPENPGFDKDGNKIPSPEVLATYTIPDIHAGYAWIDGDDQKVSPTIGVEILEFKVPYLRWWNVQVGAGSNFAYVYLGKRLTSIVEVTIGPMLAWRFDEDEWVIGIQGTLIKF